MKPPEHYGTVWNPRGNCAVCLDPLEPWNTWKLGGRVLVHGDCLDLRRARSVGAVE